MQVIHLYLIPTQGVNIDIEEEKWAEIKQNYNKEDNFIGNETIIKRPNVRSEDIEYTSTKEDCISANICIYSDVSSHNVINGWKIVKGFKYLYIYDYCSNGQAAIGPFDKLAIELHLYTSTDSAYSQNIKNFIITHKPNIYAIYINDIPLRAFKTSYNKAKEVKGNALSDYKEIKEIAGELGLSAMTFMKI